MRHQPRWNRWQARAVIGGYCMPEIPCVSDVVAPQRCSATTPFPPDASAFQPRPQTCDCPAGDRFWGMFQGLASRSVREAGVEVVLEGDGAEESLDGCGSDRGV